MTKQLTTMNVIYNFICENPGLCTYDISKILNMSGGKVRYALLRLSDIGLIKFRFQKSNPRIKKLTYPVSALELLPNGFKKKLNDK